MAEAKSGDKVRIHYTRFSNEDTVVESSHGKEPLEFVLGEGMTIPGIENAVIGMKVGDNKKVSISEEDAFGTRDEQMIVDVERSSIPSDMELRPGMMLQIRSPQGDVYNVVVVEADDEMVKLDGNHPLAGEKLIIEVELVGIV
jgi:peptidylprolyl isomerase